MKMFELFQPLYRHGEILNRLHRPITAHMQYHPGFWIIVDLFTVDDTLPAIEPRFDLWSQPPDEPKLAKNAASSRN